MHTLISSMCQWLTEKNVAHMTGLSLSTLQKHRFKGVGIPYAKIGKAVRYSYDDVQAYMLAHRIEPRS